jgi:hypothetical protein
MPFERTFDRFPAIVGLEQEKTLVSKAYEWRDDATNVEGPCINLRLEVFACETSIVSIISPSGTSVPLLDGTNHPRLPPFRVAPGLWRKMGKFCPRRSLDDHRATVLLNRHKI